MTSLADLFAEQGTGFAPQPDRLEVVAGKVVVTTNKPSPAQKRFNTLMARIDAEQALANQMRHALDAHVPLHRQAIRDMQTQSQQQRKTMVLLLDERIVAPSKPNGLTANQKQQATRILLSLCEQLARQAEDAQVQAVLARHTQADEEDDDASEQAKQHVQEILASIVGADFAQGRNFETPQDMLRAALDFEHHKRQAQEEKRQTKRAARKAKKSPAARPPAAEEKELDAQNALRTVFRQLASALHPDREPDQTVRMHKTARMSEVNAAYKCKDLSALLRIQLQTEMVDASRSTMLSDAKLKAMCNLLEKQVKSLEIDNLQMREAMEFEFGYRADPQFHEAQLLAALHDERESLQNDLAHMHENVKRVQDEKELKTWLKEQIRLNKIRFQDYGSEMDFDIDDTMMHAMMRRR